MDGNVGLSTALVQTATSQQHWINMSVCTDIRDPWRINLSDFVDPWTFLLAPL